MGFSCYCKVANIKDTLTLNLFQLQPLCHPTHALCIICTPPPPKPTSVEQPPSPHQYISIYPPFLPILPPDAGLPAAQQSSQRNRPVRVPVKNCPPDSIMYGTTCLAMHSLELQLPPLLCYKLLTPKYNPQCGSSRPMLWRCRVSVECMYECAYQTFMHRHSAACSVLIDIYETLREYATCSMSSVFYFKRMGGRVN